MAIYRSPVNKLYATVQCAPRVIVFSELYVHNGNIIYLSILQVQVHS